LTAVDRFFDETLLLGGATSLSDALMRLNFQIVQSNHFFLRITRAQDKVTVTCCQ